VIAADSRVRRDGPFLEILGTYNPLTEPSEVKINIDRAKYWIGHGAQPTPTVKKLLKIAGL
jgi:small subunit ribosomal protein S16